MDSFVSVSPGRRTEVPRRRAVYALAAALSGVVYACSLDTSGSGELASADTQPGGSEPDESVDESERDAGATRAQASSDAAAPRAPASLACRAGHYSGSYQCQYAQRGLGFAGNTTTSVTGSVEFTLLESSRPGTFTLTDGAFMPNANSLQTVSATMQGSLVCGQDFTGMLVMGQASGYFVFNSAFETPIFAAYDTKTAAFVEGTWSVPGNVVGDGCTGSWTAQYTVP